MCYYERFYYLNERIKMLRVEDYMKLPYTRIVQEMNDESGHYFYGRILELDGCQSTGDTIEELYESLNEAMEGYIKVKLENNLPIPEPERADDYSGKFNVRLPKTLHQRLAIEAQNEGVSLNTLVLYKLAL
nr:toxin-antitoxin system HicB family antitoxin [uncultured Acetatifactor sp.]